MRADEITRVVTQMFAESGVAPGAPEPLVGFVAAADPRFEELRVIAEPTHLLPGDLLQGARSVVVFFLPLEPGVVQANAAHEDEVDEQWARAYLETNALAQRITAHVTEELQRRGHRAAWLPPTDNFDYSTLVSRWSHRSVAAMAGMGSFGLNRWLITELGCCGRFSSLVTDAELPPTVGEPVERCLYFADGSCMECIQCCPVDALDDDGELDKQLCWQRCLEVADRLVHVGKAEVCGKCGVCGPCALESPV